MKFSEVIGQSGIKKQLILSAQSDKVSQAMLFLGKSGVGKLAMAMAFAQYLNCTNRTETDSCGSCASCVKASKMAHPDIFYTFPTVTARGIKKPIANDFIADWRSLLNQTAYFTYETWISTIDSGNKQGNITAEECNHIIKLHSLRHFEGQFKVHIIWGAEYLAKEGNRLLKLIEEPPANTVFLLLADNQNAILPTILSRTQITKFPRIDHQTIASSLIDKLGVPAQNAQKIAQVSEGSWLVAKQLSEEESNDYFPFVKQWLSLVIRLSRKNQINHFDELSNWVDDVSGAGRLFQRMMLNYTLYFLRESIAIQNNMPTQLDGEELKVGESVAEIINWETISEMSQLINNLHYHIVRNANAKISLMSTSLKMKALLQKQS